MERPAHRCPKKSRGFSWSRVSHASGGLTYRLYRYDMRGALHMRIARFAEGTHRSVIVPVLCSARRELRELVDDIDLREMGVVD